MLFLVWCRRHFFLLGLAVVFLLPWIAFGRSLMQDFAAIDDAFLIVNNPIVHGLSATHLKLAFTTFDPELYIPLTLLSFQLDWLLGGGSAVAFHLTNLLLHSLNAVLVGIFFTFLLREKTNAKGMALAAAMLFAVHPLHTEAVVWAAGRKDLLSTFFFLVSAILYVRSHGTLPTVENNASKNVLYVLSIITFLLGLLAKVLIATLPALLLVHSRLVRQKESVRKTLLKLSPFFILSCIFLFVAMFGKERILTSSTLLETAAMAQKSAWFYLQKLTAPTGLTVIYPFQGTISLLSPEFFLPLFVHLALFGVACWQRRRRPLLSFGILLYYLTLLPTFFNFHKGDLLFFAVDRYAYIPSIGFFLVLVLISSELAHHLRLSVRTRGICITLIVFLSVGLSMKQSAVWDSPDSLFGRSLTLYPESVSARMALGSILRERNQLKEAFDILHAGARFSDHPGLNIEAGLVYSAAGQADDAREQFRIALNKNPQLAPALFYLGFLDEHDSKIDSAIDFYKKAIDEDPSYVTVRVHLARLLIKKGKFEEAQNELTAAYAWNPVSAEVISAFTTLETARKNPGEVKRWEAWKEAVR